MILASIWIGPLGRGEDLKPPPMIAENIDSLKRHHPNLPHWLFSGEDIEAFLEKHFPREVQEAYRALKPAAYKADLARYCILHELGGVYADLAYYFARPAPFDSEKPVVFRDLIWSATWDASNSVIATPPRHKAFEQAIALVCANVTQRYYGPTFLCPTGPALFGKALAQTCNPEELTPGQTVVLKRSAIKGLPRDLDLPDSVRCLLIGRNIIAASRKSGDARGLGDLGIPDSDDYMNRWEKRDVYV